jgi:CheY-like chemotaxis protein
MRSGLYSIKHPHLTLTSSTPKSRSPTSLTSRANPRMSNLFPISSLMPWLNYCTDITMKRRSCKILVVDDNTDLCLVLEVGLRIRCSVHCENTLAGAETWLSEHKPDLLLLDNSLPDGKGLDFIKKATSICSAIKIVMMTGDRSTHLKEQALGQGAAYFIEKPFKVSVLKEIVFSVFPNISAA